MRFKWITTIGFVVAVWALSGCATDRTGQRLPAAPRMPTLYLIDSHSQVDHLVDLEDIIPLLDKAGIRTVILGRRGRVPAAKVIDFAQRYPGRVIPAVRTKGGVYARGEERYFRRLAKELRSPQFGAMSEVLLYHAQKGGKAPEIIVHPTDRRVRIALKAAVDHGWPFIIHIEFAALCVRFVSS